MSSDFHKPTKFSGDRFDSLEGGRDPAEISRVAHETAGALLARVRENPDEQVIERLVRFTDVHGIDEIAELWARSNPHSLPGSLWRIYLVRTLVSDDPHGVSYLFQRGVDETAGIDALVAGATAPTGPDEVIELTDRILRGLFEGDFAVALERAAAFCRVTSAGCTSVADDFEGTEPARSTELTRRALRLSQMAADLVACAGLWRAGSLD